MSTPIIAANKPIPVDLVEGKTYYFCSCGKSSGQPFCDGSHKGSGMAPQAFTAEKTSKAFLCQCKSTGNSPFCDGTHSGIPDEKVGTPVN